MEHGANTAETDWHMGCFARVASTVCTIFEQLVSSLLDDETCEADGSVVAVSFDSCLLRCMEGRDDGESHAESA